MKTALRFAPVSALLLFASVAVAPVSPAYAGSGLNTWRWGDAGYTISSASFKYSNMTGFWQTVVNDLGSNTCQLTVDGVYGNVTTWFTAMLQNEILGYNNGGVMTTSMLNAVHGKKVGSQLRLGEEGYVDGCGTIYYYYYYAGGGNQPTNRLGWNGFSSQWLFAQYPAGNPPLMTLATPSRTIGSVGACS